jgi:sigma-54 dependent transcriptional regulator, acetoin dehydrogenase operon transcriptional activator AcoR
MSRLKSIQDSAQQTAIAIAAALGVEVAIIDANCDLVASSKGYVDSKGSEIYKPYSRAVMKEKTIICSSPGHFIHCKGCRLEGKCPLTAEVQCAIEMDKESIGLITMVALNEEQRFRLLGKTDTLLEFIHEMAQMLVTKIHEKEHIELINKINCLIETTLDSINDGIIAFDNRGMITHANKVACKLLQVSSSELVNSSINKIMKDNSILDLILTGQSILYKEYVFQGLVEIHCLISIRPIYNEGIISGGLLSLSDIRDIRTVINEIMGMQGNATFKAIIGRSKEIEALKQHAFEISKSDSTILIQGESGTGKELFARAIHSASPRSKEPFVAINCAAIPDMLLESELFGYEQGAFTGARKGGKRGKCELAEGGTLFLDEVGDIPLHLQVKFLRILQEHSFERVGGTRTILLNIRIIAATNQDLESKIQTGEFREDLFYRLNVIPILIAPLRERRTDIPVLCDHFLDYYNRKLKKNITGITPASLEMLCNYSWPGNVRELENAIEYATNLENGRYITVNSLPKRILLRPFHKGTLPERVKEYEINQIIDTLNHYGWGSKGKQKAAQELGISVPSLYRKLVVRERGPLELKVNFDKRNIKIDKKKLVKHSKSSPIS